MAEKPIDSLTQLAPSTMDSKSKIQAARKSAQMWRKLSRASTLTQADLNRLASISDLGESDDDKENVFEIRSSVMKYESSRPNSPSKTASNRRKSSRLGNLANLVTTLQNQKFENSFRLEPIDGKTPKLKEISNLLKRTLENAFAGESYDEEISKELLKGICNEIRKQLVSNKRVLNLKRYKIVINCMIMQKCERNADVRVSSKCLNYAQTDRWVPMEFSGKDFEVRGMVHFFYQD